MCGVPRILLALLAVLALSAAPAQAHSNHSPQHGHGHHHGHHAQPRTVDLQVLGLNDLHGNLEPTLVSGKDAGGVAWLGGYIAAARAQNPKGTIVAHAGDTVGASPLISSWFHDEPTIVATNLMGLDVGTLGNHEFDEGGTEMLRLINGGHRDDGKQFKDGVDTSDPDFPGADYPYVSANVTYADSGRYVLPPFTVIKREGIKVGFIGVTTTETPSIVVPDAVAPFKFGDISDAVNKQVKVLHRLGVHTIVVLAHAGGFMTPAPTVGRDHRRDPADGPRRRPRRRRPHPQPAQHARQQRAGRAGVPVRHRLRQGDAHRRPAHQGRHRLDGRRDHDLPRRNAPAPQQDLAQLVQTSRTASRPSRRASSARRARRSPATAPGSPRPARASWAT